MPIRTLRRWAVACFGMVLLAGSASATEPFSAPTPDARHSVSLQQAAPMAPMAPVPAPAALAPAPPPVSATPAPVVATGSSCANSNCTPIGSCSNCCQPCNDCGSLLSRFRLRRGLLGTCSDAGCSSFRAETNFLFGSCNSFFNCHRYRRAEPAPYPNVPPPRQAVPVGHCEFGTFMRY